VIDVHTHIGRLRLGHRRLTAGKLVRWMDRKGIDQAVVLAIENPEELDFYVPTPYILRSCRRYPDRLIPFCNVDPRIRNANPNTPFEDILAEHKANGARGFGEMLAGLPLDDPRLMAIYQACGRLELPVMLHLDHLRGIDDVGLPGLRRVLEACPDTTFLAHGPHWWAEISADCTLDQRGAYPKTPVQSPGAVEHIFERFPNVYGDLSAASGYNAVTRDPDFGRAFLERWQDRLCFGTDYLEPGQQTPIIDFIRTVDISEPARRKITQDNAARILKIEKRQMPNAER
jgi:hypothetical protein